MRKFSVLDYPRSEGSTYLTGITPFGPRCVAISGYYSETDNGVIGFVYVGPMSARARCGRFHNLVAASRAGAITEQTFCQGVEKLGNEDVEVIANAVTFEGAQFGYYYRGSLRGSGTWHQVNIADSQQVSLQGLANHRWIVGTHDTTLSFVYNIPRRIFSDIAFPLSTVTTVRGICRRRHHYLVCGSVQFTGEPLAGFLADLFEDGTVRNWQKFHFNEDTTQNTRFTAVASTRRGTILLTGDMPVAFTLHLHGRELSWQTLSSPPTVTALTPLGIDTAGTIVGSCFLDGATQGFISQLHHHNEGPRFRRRR